MCEGTTKPRSGLRILVVEDEYVIAADMARSLEDLGMTVAGPVASVADALGTIEREPAPDAAILDISLGGEKVFTLADTLLERGVPSFSPPDTMIGLFRVSMETSAGLNIDMSKLASALVFGGSLGLARDTTRWLPHRSCATHDSPRSS